MYAFIRRLQAIALMVTPLGLALPLWPQTPSSSATPQNSPPPRPAFTPTPEMLAIQAASEKEQKREMEELGIKDLRPGVDADPKSARAANYDESKANVYPNLPDPLVLNDGKRVTTAQMWWSERRPEIAEMFDREILGRTPDHLPKVTWEVKSVVHERKGDVPVVTKTLAGHVDNAADPAITVTIDLTLTTPANAKGPVPVLMEYGLSKEFLAMLAKRFPQFAQQAQQHPTWQEQVLAKGWGYAEYIPTSVQEDNGAGLTKGIIGLVNKGQPRRMDDWGTLKAWGWGASKCVDYFETDKDVDAKQVGLEGHSRYGKSVLVTMAYDPRFAIAYVSSSGEGGAKLYRHVFGEQVGNVAAANEFHWMAGNFLKYAGPLTPSDMPVDNHELIAMCAPRPVFISGGSLETEERWIDPKGMFLAAVAAGPVYRLLGKKDLGTTEFPPMGTPLIEGDLAFRQHSAGHTPGPNWPTFLEFAGRYLHAGGQATAAGGVSKGGAPVHLTAAEDRERLLGLLGLKDADMRRPPATGATQANATNYDESKANVYPQLPDPLVMKNGERVTSEEMWFDQRRPEIVADFEREIWGRAPANLPPVRWEVVSTNPGRCGDVDVVMKRLTGHVDNAIDPQIPVNISLILVTPAKTAVPVPVIMELAFDKEFQRINVGQIAETVSGGAPGYGINWQTVLDKGWGFAVLSPTSFQADDGAGLTEGIIGLMNKGQPRSLDDWGTLRAWAWGASRAMDYFETDKAVDARQVGLAGHSRFGKTVLVAMAYDARFAIAYSSSSGEGGAKLYRHIFGEQMPNLASASLYHWFDGNFLRYGGPRTPADLPVDNHELIALSAPRPVFIGGGASTGDGYVDPHGDAWADPRGMFLAEVAAGPVYRLLGRKDLGTSDFPPMETPLIDGDLAFRQHARGHTPVPNWGAFLEFASHYLRVSQSAPVLAKASVLN